MNTHKVVMKVVNSKCSLKASELPGKGMGIGADLEEQKEIKCIECFYAAFPKINDKLEAIKALPPEGLPDSLRLFCGLFEYGEEGRVIDPHLALALGTDIHIGFDDFLIGFEHFTAAVEAVYDDLCVGGNIKVLHDGRLRFVKAEMNINAA